MNRIRGFRINSFLWLCLVASFTGEGWARAPRFHKENFSKWSLWNQGTRLRGANIHQRRVYPQDGTVYLGPGPLGPPYTQADMNRMAEWGANVVHISHPGLFSESPPYSLDSAVQANLDSLVEMADRAGLYVVIGFRTGPGRSEFTFFWNSANPDLLNDSLWQDSDAQDAWAAMWQYTAQRYGSREHVIGYNLMVGPNSNEVGSDALNGRLDIWDPAQFYALYGGSLYDWNQLYPGISEAIRAVDGLTPILIESMGYGSVDWLPWLEPTSDTMTVYAVHQYDPLLYTHQEGIENSYPDLLDTDNNGEEEDFDWDWIVRRFAVLDTFQQRHGVPVAVTEYGVSRWAPHAADFVQDQLERFEFLGINHCIWLWQSSHEQLAVYPNPFNLRFGPDPENHCDVESSDLIEILLSNWACNTECHTDVPAEPVQPAGIALHPNFPNPFNGRTAIAYTLKNRSLVTLSIYSILGRLVKRLVYGVEEAGSRRTNWDAERLPSGLYLARLKVVDLVTGEQQVRIQKMVLKK